MGLVDTAQQDNNRVRRNLLGMIRAGKIIDRVREL